MRHFPRTIAILLMCASAFIIPVVDTIAKALTAVSSPFFLVFLRYAFGAFLALVVFRAPGRSLRSFRAAGTLHFCRSALLVAAMVCFYWSISELPVATALGGFFIGPVIAMLLSVLFLRESLSASKCVAVLLGFSGAMLILRPEGGFSHAALLALGSGVLSGVYLVLTRAAAVTVRAEDNVLIQSFVGAVLVAPLALADLPTPAVTEMALMGLMCVLSFAAHILFLAAFRTLDVGTLAPLAYLELAVAAFLGWALFGYLPQILTWAGILCVVGGGLLVTRPPRPVPPKPEAVGPAQTCKAR